VRVLERAVSEQRLFRVWDRSRQPGGNPLCLFISQLAKLRGDSAAKPGIIYGDDGSFQGPGPPYRDGQLAISTQRRGPRQRSGGPGMLASHFLRRD
jgi:hypothetical protein